MVDCPLVFIGGDYPLFAKSKISKRGLLVCLVKWGRCFLYIAVWVSTLGYQLLTILTQYCSIHCSSVTLPCGMWHLVPYYFSAISISNSVIPLSSIACGSIKCLVIGWLPPPYSFIVFHSFALSVHKLSKHIASTLLVPGIDSWHLRSLGLKECCWAGSGPQCLALCPPLLMEVTRDTPLQELRIFCFMGVRGAPHTLFVHMYRKISKSSEVHHTSFCHYLCQ